MGWGRTVRRYGEALIYVLSALAIRWATDPYLVYGLPFLFFFIAVAFTAWRAGVGPGLVASGLSSALAAYYFLPQPGLLAWDSGQLLTLGIFLAEAAILTLLISGLNRAKEQVQRINTELEEKVAQKTRNLEDTYARVRSLTTELAHTEQRGRRQLALELHDYLAQLLVVTRMKLTKMSQSIKDPRVRDEITSIDETLHELLTYCRTLMAELNPAGLDTGDLATAFRGLADRMAREGLKVTLDITPSCRIVPESAIALYQSVRELLFNVLKHAKVEAAAVSVTTDARGQLCVVVEDKGVGFDPANGFPPAAGHLGLVSVHERMSMLGGRCIVQSKAGQGTRIELVVPARTPYD